jgi:signal transduction histidine kinase
MATNERRLTWVGVLTWFCVGIPSVLWEIQHHTLFTPRAGALFAAFALFLVLFLIATRPGCDQRFHFVLLLLEAAAAFLCSWLQPLGFLPVLLVIVAGQLGTWRLSVAIPFIAIQSVLLGFLVAATKGPALPFAAAYFSFSLFALFTMHIAHGEREARQKLTEANAELKVTAGLLDISSRTSERLRIARDLHDLMGHHLAALSLNLETASHLATGDALTQIEISKTIAKRLLADVRSVVSRLREEEPVDLTAALGALREVITTPALHLELPPELAVADPTVAQVALRSVQEIVTNAVRHSGARNLWLRVSWSGGLQPAGPAQHSLVIDARDDGAGTDHVRFGNGLTGLRERVEQLRGTFEVSSLRGRGFNVHVRLPVAGGAA